MLAWFHFALPSFAQMTISPLICTVLDSIWAALAASPVDALDSAESSHGSPPFSTALVLVVCLFCLCASVLYYY